MDGDSIDDGDSIQIENDDSYDTADENSVDNYKTVETFFAETERISKTIPLVNCDIGSSSMVSILRPYQRETVQWMIDRERNQKEVQIGPWEIILPAGGVLADEMGLGKTVELLACILGNPKKIEPFRSVAVKSEQSVVSFELKSPKKRKSTSIALPSFLKKKPRLSSIKQNRQLKKEIECLLRNYFSEFKNKFIAKKSCTLNEKCKSVAEVCFKIILLNRFYQQVTHNYSKQQAWGYLISEFDVDHVDSIGYSILLKDTENNGTYDSPANNALSDDEATQILLSVNEFLSEKTMKRFEKEFGLKLVFSLNVSGDECIPLLEGDNVRCKCGSDKVYGDKITCTKCGLSQHLFCVGLSVGAEPVDYKCPTCWMSEPPIESAATLIMVPPSLAVQWQNEIKKHAADANLKLFLYEGMNKNYLLPPLLAQYDIVLVTFSTLRSELSFVTNQTRNLRHTKRYHSFVTPLTCIYWWRACCDEAQIVETSNQVSQMTAHLKYVYSWAVTGTPIGKSLHDLFGLTKFLRIQPFVESSACWNTLIENDQSLLHQLFAYIMRRKTKVNVSDQLHLPTLITETVWLSFPPTEGYFYNSTHSTSQKAFFQKFNCIKNINQPLKKANRSTVSSLLKPLLSLRQACVNPFLVNKMVAQFSLRKKNTMRELLPKMTQKTKTDCEDALRLYVMFVNGAAATRMSTHNYGEAVTVYREVLRKMTLFENLIPDSFQMIHVMHNLYEAASEDPTIELTDEEKNFPQRIEELEKKSLGKKQELVEAMQLQFNKFNTEIENALDGHDLKTFCWWKIMLDRLNFDDILPRIHEALETRHIELTSAWKLKLRSTHHLTESLRFWLLDVAEKRSVIFLFMKQITNNDVLENLWIAAESCHIRKTDPRRTCLACRMENIMLKYEALIFNTGANEEMYPGDKNLNPIDWKMSASECILNVIVSSYRMAVGPNTDTLNASNQLIALSFLKREFKTIRAIWSRQCDLLHVYDEIRMAKSTHDVTAENALENNESLVVEQRLMEYEMQSKAAYAKVQSKYGSLQYLMNLQKRYENSENIEESCPVCQNSIDEVRAVLMCGHFTCYCCMQSLIEHGRCNDRIQCPMCRTFAPLSSITHVYGGGTSECDMSHVAGNFSIKIRAVSAKIMDLVGEDRNVKILLFSTWEDVLKEMEKALKLNRVSCIRFRSPATLTAFKTDQNINVLLLPLRSGSKGLNITEASHVIFTEPALNLADENQAIGRIYRLGQSKNMTVHKFILKQSVEHQIYRMNEEMASSSCKYELTFRHLRSLFDNSFGNTFDEM